MNCHADVKIMDEEAGINCSPEDKPSTQEIGAGDQAAEQQGDAHIVLRSGELFVDEVRYERVILRL